MILFIIFALTVSTLALEELNCDFPTKFKLVKKGLSQIEEAKVKLSFARDTLNIFTYPATNEVNFVINETVIDIKGLSEDEDFPDFYANKMDHTIHTQTLGVAILEHSLGVFQLKNCRTFVPRNHLERANFQYEIEDEILRLAAKCINMNLSIKLGNLKSHDFAGFEDSFDFGPLSVDHHNKSPTLRVDSSPASEMKKKFSVSQSTLNKIVDSAMVKIVPLIKTTDRLKIQLPIIDDPVKIVMIGDVNLTLFNGYLSNFTTAKRTSDIVLDRDGDKFSVAFGLGLIDPIFKYNFTVKKTFDILKTKIECNSNLTASLRDLVFEVKVAIDLRKNSCNTTLEHLQVTRAGALVLHLNTTDMGACSMAKDSVIEQWQSGILQKSHKIVEGFLRPLLRDFNCQIFSTSNIFGENHGLDISVINVKRQLSQKNT